ncbi:hypothetical protein D3C75_692000 [compost metagenome]
MLQIDLHVAVGAWGIRKNVDIAEVLQLPDILICCTEGSIIDLSGLQELPHIACRGFVDEMFCLWFAFEVILIGYQPDFLSGDEFLQLVRTVAERFLMQLLDVLQLAECIIFAVVSLGQHVGAEDYECCRIWLFQCDRDGLRINDFDAFNCCGCTLFIGLTALHIQRGQRGTAIIGFVVLNRPGKSYIIRRKRRTVAEFQVLVQVESICKLILRNLPAFR